MRVVVKDNFREYADRNKQAMDIGMINMARDGVMLARAKMPLKSTNMFMNTWHVALGFLKHRILVNTEYAAYQERGERLDGSHKVEKYTTPSTGKDFLKNAGEKVSSNALNYLKQAARQLRPL